MKIFVQQVNLSIAVQISEALLQQGTPECVLCGTAGQFVEPQIAN